MKSVMIDIETLSTRPDACVISFGLAAFDDSGVFATEGCVIRAEEWNGHMDPATVRWWFTQSEQARAAVVAPAAGARSALGAANTLGAFLVDYGNDELWANDPDFDVVIIRAWWERVCGTGNKFPVSYKASRSCRTIYAEAKRRSIDLSSAWENHVPHDAVSDAICQAKAVILARNSF